MKTNFKSFMGNNVQKAILRSAAVIISFILISFTVSAQEFWKNLLTHSSFNEIAIAMTETKEKTDVPAQTGTFTPPVLYTVQDYDEELKLENWMTKDFYFEIPCLGPENETENGLELEGWMINKKLFAPEKIGDGPMELESWMVSDEIWES